jgi:hypothetical protein
VVPRSSGGKATCVFLVLIPMLAAFGIAGWWMMRAKQVMPSSLELYTSHGSLRREDPKGISSPASRVNNTSTYGIDDPRMNPISQVSISPLRRGVSRADLDELCMASE